MIACAEHMTLNQWHSNCPACQEAMRIYELTHPWNPEECESCGAPLKPKPGHQTKLGSFVEAWANILVGYVVAVGTNFFVLPAFGFTTMTAKQNFAIGGIFTVVSLVRSYIIRRWFNGFKWGNGK